MSEAIGAREAHSLKIRAALIEACGDLLAKHPIDGIKISDIVATAGVAKGSFYNHFQDKESLAFTVSSAIREEVEQEIFESNLNVTDPAYKIARGICNYVRLAVESPRQALIMLRSHELATTGDFPLNKNIQLEISDGVKSSRFAARSEKTGILQIIGVTYFTVARIVEQQLSVEESIDLSVESITLILCGFGLAEEEAVRIVRDSAKDIIGRKRNGNP